MSTKRTIHDSHEKFISEGYKVIELLFNGLSVNDGSGLINSDINIINSIWPTFSSMLLKIPLVKKLEAENTQAILTLLKDGEISIDDAKTLMDTLRIANEVNVLPDLLERMEEMKAKK